VEGGQRVLCGRVSIGREPSLRVEGLPEGNKTVDVAVLQKEDRVEGGDGDVRHVADAAGGKTVAAADEAVEVVVDVLERDLVRLFRVRGVNV